MVCEFWFFHYGETNKKFCLTFKNKKREFPPRSTSNVRLNEKQTEMSSSAWQWQHYLPWLCKNKSAILPYEKASVYSLPCVAVHVETITVVLYVFLGSYGKVNSMAGRVLHQPKAQQQLACMNQNDKFSDIVKKDADKQEGQSQ